MERTVLIIEDEKLIIVSTQMVLEAAGFRVESATNGEDGIAKARSQSPDLILLDIMMPVGMGFSVAERLKDLGLGDIPIIFITASKRAGLRKMAQQLGAAGFFEKPYDADQLLAAIHLILGPVPFPAAHTPSSTTQRLSP